jgi:hypothetical protein
VPVLPIRMPLSSNDDQEVDVAELDAVAG